MTERSKRMIAELDPRAQPIFVDFHILLDKELGESQYITYEGLRKSLVQEAYYAQGRQSLGAVNALRCLAGMRPLRSEADNYIITWTLKSKHIDGLAMDVLPVDGTGKETWDLGHYWKQFNIILDCGRAVGLICGADWKPADWPHHEIRG